MLVGRGMATDLAPVTPEVLRWARESVGASVADAATRAGTTEDRVRAWESGQAEPTLAKLRALSKLYQRPISVFFLPKPPTTFDAMRDFRRLPGVQDHAWSRALHKIYRRAIDQQDAAADLMEADNETPKVTIPRSSVDVPAEDVARTARQVLGVRLAEQFSWRRPEDAFAGWMEAVEAAGVFVLRTSEVPMEEMRGFSIASGFIPVIVVNALDWPRGQVFTLLHEFAHLMLREGGLCDLLEPDSGQGQRVEAWCNAVAAATLMPGSDFLDNEVLRSPGLRDWDEDVLAQLSDRWGVSREAVIRRLVTLQRAPMAFYLRKRAEYQALYAAQREEERLRRQRSGSKGGPPPYRMAIRDRGKPYVRLVLDAYQRDLITTSSLSSLLSLKVKHLPALEREVRS
jgi:Zn-dependent peptidase ImmA (M78 family)/transcriptional regulator with XRE-family HTH domain